MKQFHYSLQSVLEYENGVLDKLKGEYAERMKLVNDKKNFIAQLQKKSSDLLNEFDAVKHEGASIERFLLYSSMIGRIEEQIRKEQERLARLEDFAAKKKEEVVAANIDVSKFEKLKEKRREEYHIQVQKDQENFIDEFVSYQSKTRDNAS
ncbi:flagellar FliJ protein [[Clostridium] aminophilum]|uniref:Flagellar FliJ protein n=1 Tax=[Clostridium] aminophilum TaxID=1526 RepID=A0A1I0BTD3_9FIRM|nr:flagellar export protein FliJ [[Clostridium] aminophilum]SET09623.1 flagellar FliJ protein [[Clostridium] aminophilum]